MLREQLLQPTAEALADFVRRRLRQGGAMLLVAPRRDPLPGAASLAEAGNDLLLLKADGSLQIHGPRGVKPVNWQPKTDAVSARVVDDLCPDRLASLTRGDGHRHLPGNQPRAGARTGDESGFLLAGSEEHLQGTLSRHPELIEPGLTVLNRGLLTDVGGLDLWARDTAGQYVVIEPRRGTATQRAVHQ